MSEVQKFSSLPISLQPKNIGNNNKGPIAPAVNKKPNSNIKRVQRLYTEMPSKQGIQSRLKKATEKNNNKHIKFPSSSSATAVHHLKASKSFKTPKLNTLGDHLACPFSKEQLIEQNLQLKSAFNELKEELSQQRISAQAEKRKNKTFITKLSREFKKDFYYSNIHKNETKNVSSNGKQYNYSAEGSSPYSPSRNDYSEENPPANVPYLNKPVQIAHSAQYMVAGVKNQYEKLKQKYEILEKQHNQLKKTDVVQKLEEFKVYSAMVEEQNKRLADKIQVLKLKCSQNPEEKKEGEEAEAEEKLQKLRKKNSSLKEQIKNLKKECKQNKKVINYLETLLINRDNHQQKNEHRVKIVEKHNLELERILAQEREHLEEVQLVFKTQLQQISHKHARQVQKQKHVFDNVLNERNQTIKKLEKDIVYLSTVLSYWKPSNADDEPQTAKTKTRKESISQKQKLMGVEKATAELYPPDKTSIERQELKQSYSGHQEEESLRISTKPRKRKTAAMKNENNVKKTRKVSLDQLQNRDLPEYLKYRLIGLNLTLAEINKYFQPLKKASPQDQPDNETQREWKDKYITQKQLTQILIAQPFKLSEENSYLLSRYIVEDQYLFEKGDVSNPFVYEDQNNEIERNLIKSIMRAFILDNGQNIIPTGDNWSPEQLEKSWIQTLQKSGGRLSTALSSIAPKGTISKSKWKDLLPSIGMEIGEQEMEWCIGKMILQSESISTMKYQSLLGYDHE